MARALLADGRAPEVARMLEPLLDSGSYGLRPNRREEVVLRSLLARIRLLEERDVDAALSLLQPVASVEVLSEAGASARAEVELWLGWCGLMSGDAGDQSAAGVRLAVAAALAERHAAPETSLWCHVGRAWLASSLGFTSLSCQYADAARRIQHAIQAKHAVEWLDRLPCGQEVSAPDVPDFIATSSNMQDVMRGVRQAAAQNIGFLVVGERGTGRRHLARSVHVASRADGPFLLIRADNASARPEEVLARAEGAVGATLCLHEVDELPISAQKRVIEVAGRSEARMVCTSSHDFVSLVDSGRVHRSVLEAIALLQIHLPPLRKRSEDVELLVRHFLRSMRREEGLPPAVTDEAMELFVRYSWPGNARQLRNEIERALVHVQSEPAPVIRASILSPEIRGPERTGDEAASRDEGDLDRILAQTERAVIESVLAQTGGQVAASADQLGLTRQGLYKKMKRLNIDPTKYQNGREASAETAGQEDRQYA